MTTLAQRIADLPHGVTPRWLGYDLTSWAIFEQPDDPVALEQSEIAEDDPGLLAVLDAYDLELVDE